MDPMDLEISQAMLSVGPSAPIEFNQAPTELMPLNSGPSIWSAQSECERHLGEPDNPLRGSNTGDTIPPLISSGSLTETTIWQEGLGTSPGLNPYTLPNLNPTTRSINSDPKQKENLSSAPDAKLAAAKSTDAQSCPPVEPPFSPSELIDHFKTLNPSLAGTNTFQLVQEIFEQCRSSNDDRTGVSPVVQTILQVDDALDEVFKVRLRDVQLMNVIMMTALPEKCGRLGEVHTGEGKSHIVRAVAAIKILQNSAQFIDIVTTAENLAQRDAEASKKFFEKLGITCDHMVGFSDRVAEIRETEQQRNKDSENQTSDLSGKGPAAASVVYGTVHLFSAMFLSDFNESTNVYKQRLCKRSSTDLLVDEVDSMLVDSKSNATLLSTKCSEQSQTLLTIQKTIYFLMSSMLVYELMNKEASNLSLPDPKERDTAHKAVEGTHQGPYSQDEILSACRSKAFSTAEVLKLPKREQAIFDSSYEAWVNSCYQALSQLKEQVDYVIHNGKIQIVDHSNTGEIQTNSRWGAGLHRFLEMKYGLKLEDDNLVCHSLSNFGFFRLYGNRITGLTGTLGSEITQDFLRSTYGVMLYSSPPFKRRKLEILDPILTLQEPDAFVIDNIKKVLRNERPILLINKDIETCMKMEANIKQAVLPHFPHLKVKQYYNSEGDKVQEVLQDVDGATIIVASNLAGRGTDIEISDEIEAKGGLHVIQTHLPHNERVKKQAEGRAGRKGQRGTAITIYQADPDLVALMEKNFPNQILTPEIMSQLHQKQMKGRAQKEKNLMEQSKQEVAWLLLKDECYSNFTSVINEYPHVKKNRHSLDDLSNQYSVHSLQIQDLYERGTDCDFEFGNSQTNESQMHKDVIESLRKKSQEFTSHVRSLCRNSDSQGKGIRPIDYTLIAKNEKDFLSQAKRAVESDPNSLEAKVCLGIALFNSGDYSGAEKTKTECRQQQQLVMFTAKVEESRINDIQPINILSQIEEDHHKCLDLHEQIKCEEFKAEMKFDFPQVATAAVDKSQSQVGFESLVTTSATVKGTQESLVKSNAVSSNLNELAVLKANLKDTKTKMGQKCSQIRSTFTDSASSSVSAANQQQNSTVQLSHENSSVDVVNQNLAMLEEALTREDKEQLKLSIQQTDEKELVPPVSIQKKDKSVGYLGYIIGAAAVIGGFVIGFTTQNWMLGADLIFAGVDMCIQNHKMNEEGTYCAKQIMTSALKHAVSIILSADLTPVVGKLKGFKWFNGRTKSIIEGAVGIQEKFFRHINIGTMCAVRMGEMLSKHSDIKLPMNFAKFALSGNQTVMEKLKNPLNLAVSACALAKDYWDYQNVPKKLEGVAPENLKKREKLIMDKPAKILSEKLLQRILQPLKNSPRTVNFGLFANEGSKVLQNIKEGFESSVKGNAKRVPTEIAYKLGLVDESEIHKEPVVSTIMDGALNNLVSQISNLEKTFTQYPSPDLFFSNDLPNLDQDRKKFQKENQECEAEKQRIQTQINQGVPQATLQPAINTLQARYSAAQQGLHRCEVLSLVNQPDFKQLFQQTLENHLRTCAESKTPPTLSLDAYKEQMQASNNEAKASFCKATHQWIEKKGQLVFNNWAAIQAQWMPTIFPWCVAEVKAQAIEKCKE